MSNGFDPHVGGAEGAGCSKETVILGKRSLLWFFVPPLLAIQVLFIGGIAGLLQSFWLGVVTALSAVGVFVAGIVMMRHLRIEVRLNPETRPVGLTVQVVYFSRVVRSESWSDISELEIACVIISGPEVGGVFYELVGHLADGSTTNVFGPYVRLLFHLKRAEIEAVRNAWMAMSQETRVQPRPIPNHGGGHPEKSVRP
jgi:hypothetical protein